MAHENFLCIKRQWLALVVYFCAFALGILASGLVATGFAHPFLRGLFAGVATMYGAIFILSGAIRLICGNRSALGVAPQSRLKDDGRRELKESNR